MKNLTEGRARVITSKPVFMHAPHAQCHAATVLETGRGMLTAWFAGTHEGHPDVAIWMALENNGVYSAPGQLFKINSEPHWNPVLARLASATVCCFFRVGANPRAWRSYISLSRDEGANWEPPMPMPEGFLGPIKNKPVLLGDFRLVCPSSTEQSGWGVHVEFTDLPDLYWHRAEPPGGGRELGCIQPALLPWPNGKLQMLCRTRSGCIATCWSQDKGLTWSAVVPTQLPNPNSGIDALMLSNCTALLVYNPHNTERSPLRVATSSDGTLWEDVLELEFGEGEYSYPAVIQDSLGQVHVVYTRNRVEIVHAVINVMQL